MPRATPVNERLADALAGYVEAQPRVGIELRRALGMTDGANLVDPEFPVAGFFIAVEPGEDAVLRVFVLTPGRLVIYEIRTLLPQPSLTIVVPIERVARIEHYATAEVNSLVVELDADKTVTSYDYPEPESDTERRARVLSGEDDADPAPDPLRVRSTTRPAFYQLVQGPTTSSLDDFARALANVMGR